MPTEQAVQPLNVAGATLLIQLLLLGIMATTLWLQPETYSHSEESPYRLFPTKMYLRKPRYPALLFASLASVAALTASDQFYGVWKPLFQGLEIHTIPAASAINGVFIIDIIVSAYLIFVTGGSRESPFTPVLFTLPALAIFLRVSPTTFSEYAAAVGIIYLVCLNNFGNEEKQAKAPLAFMSIGCLALSMFTGYITRPTSIEQLGSTSALTQEGSKTGASMCSPIGSPIHAPPP